MLQRTLLIIVVVIFCYNLATIKEIIMNNVKDNTIHDSMKSNIYAEKMSSYNERKIHYTNEQTKTLPTNLNNLIHIVIFMFSQLIMGIIW